MNLNDLCYVKLTTYGKTIVSQLEYPCRIKEIGGGWSEWQLWILMNTFGKTTRIGNETEFEKNEILFKRPV